MVEDENKTSEIKPELKEKTNEDEKMEVDVNVEENKDKDTSPAKKSSPSTPNFGANPNLNYRVKVSGLPRFYSSTVSRLLYKIIFV